MSNETLFSTGRIGAIAMQSRIIMAPMTRCRTSQPGNIPNAMMAEYYRQRASAGMILTEATQISPSGQGYSFTPGIHTSEQVEGWKTVVDEVHNENGKIVCQLWHVGRMSHPVFHNGNLPVAPSAIAPNASVWIADETGTGAMKPCPTPRELTTDEVRAIVKEYKVATENAVQAGFDGIEIHGANGYLIDQFLRTSSNHRTDLYGGSLENRIRVLLEIVDAAGSVIGYDRIGVRLSPHNETRGMNCPEMIEMTYRIAEELAARGVAYIHFAEADWDEAPEIPTEFRAEIRKRFGAAILVAGKYTKERAEQILAKGFADFIAFGRPFIANPDLPKRLAGNIPLASFDEHTLFGGTEKGYSDYTNSENRGA